MSPILGLDAQGMPVPLVNAPEPLVPDSAGAMKFKPASSASSDHPYLHFVSLDLALCDDLVTALCFHMRRAQQQWSLRPKASAEAIKAMELFEGFFTYVYSFRVRQADR